MRTLLTVLAIIFLSGCRTYGIEKGVDDAGNPFVKVEISSSADIEVPRVHYNRNGDVVTFDFSADGIDNNTADYMGMFSGMMGMYMQMMENMMMRMSAPTP